MIALVALVAVVAALAVARASSDRQMVLSTAVTIFAVGLWATAVIPEYITALILFVLALVLSIAPPSLVFSGFHSSAIWLVFGGFVLGAAAENTGVGTWLAARILATVGHSYRGIIAAFVVGGIVLGFLIPSSMGRIMLLLPIVQAFAKEVGFAKGSVGGHGLLMALLVGTYVVPMTILPANLPNVILLGSADTLYDHAINYGRYLATHFPISGLAKGVIATLMICWLFPATVAKPDSEISVPALDGRGRWMLCLLAVTLLLWMTDSIHGVSPGWICMAAAVICLLPGISFVSDAEFESRVSLTALIYVCGCIAVGAIVSDSGIGERFARLVTESLRIAPGEDFRNYMSLSVVAVATSMFVTMGGIMPVLTPIAGGLAEATGWSLEAVFALFVNGSSTPILPYVAGPIIVALRLSETPYGVAARILVPLAIVSVAVLIPLNYLWWSWLGFYS
ncbi:MAG: SLC13 family permease [Gammaproteobacteria bacterium]